MTTPSTTRFLVVDNRWDLAAAPTNDAMAECVYCTRLIGSDPNLVLHGGGNSSVKLDWHDITGTTIPALRVKGSGWDMGTIEAPGFTPLPLARLHDLLSLSSLSDPEMMRELSAARLDPAAPQPSVESMLHAYLPHRAVQHSHADPIVQLTNLADREATVRRVFGDRVVVVPYVMPGFDLARAVRDIWPDQVQSNTIGMVLLNHGLFTFGDTSLQAYERHVELISAAETWLHAQVGPSLPTMATPLPDALLTDLADLRRQMSAVAGFPLITRRHDDPAVQRFVGRSDLGSLSQRGPLTPDHVIRTKRVPMVGRDVAAYAADYAGYYSRNKHRGRVELSMLDAAPRVVLDPELGMITAGRTAKDAAIAADIYHHTIPVLERAEDHLGGYVALPEGDLFDCEYWDLEQAKLRLAGAPPPFAGMVGLVTGAASGIGRACAAELTRRGAAVVGIDRGESAPGAASMNVVADVTDPTAQAAALRTIVEQFGGLDVVVIAAGIFGATVPIAEMSNEEWRKVLSVNLDAVADLLHIAHPLLARSPVGGRVVIIGSKNVPAPGKGAAAYSASKAALTQLARVAALEWAADRIRVNVVHPDAVFDTGLWTPELLAERAKKYDMTVDEYKKRNLLGTEVTSAGVARVVAELCSDTFSATTGAQIPIDGGNDRVV
jgi:rhamnose utilization protein RhaD (predicted bifunctional aldolase and dehydrogenase)/NAD(P)-dependent dehydrogenase (short-subunit alcohol dehydrogenase family)